MKCIEVSFDVTSAVALDEPCHIAGTLFLPAEGRALRSPSILALLVPGGGFTRRYYNLQVSGYEDYSAAAMLAEAGIASVAVDGLGTGGSSIPEDGRRVTLDKCAAAIADVARQLRGSAAAGELPDPLSDETFIVGVGHSLGGCVMTLQQGAHGACDAVAILGYSCQYIKSAVDPATGARLRPRIPIGALGYNRSDPREGRARNYSPSVPEAIIDDEERDRVAMPDGVAEVLIPGRSAPSAARIATPVLLGFGDQDVSPDPYAEPAFYRASGDITLLIAPDAAHCHNSASSRIWLWQRIGGWMEAAARSIGRPKADPL